MNNPGQTLRIPSGHLLRELYTECAIVPGSILVGNQTYPVDFNLEQVIQEGVDVAGAIETIPGSLEKYLMHLQARSLYLLHNDIQIKVSNSIVKYISGLYNIIVMHKLLDDRKQFKWRYLNKSDITFDITLIKVL